jgi:predicted ABC-type ATPase
VLSGKHINGNGKVKVVASYSMNYISQNMFINSDSLGNRYNPSQLGNLMYVPCVNMC